MFHIHAMLIISDRTDDADSEARQQAVQEVLARITATTLVSFDHVGYQTESGFTGVELTKEAKLEDPTRKVQRFACGAKCAVYDVDGTC